MSEALVCFLYVLARDELPVGVVEAIMREHVEAKSELEKIYSNPHLEAWAREVAARIEACR